ncbi:hypothetical protein AB0M45_10665 [Nocardia sp. NPDC051787]|uniref:hypothetical protein n=1 Tax=Nocardia sp. NPDC051787 TaxID=3155415 RepID=UPI003429A589
MPTTITAAPENCVKVPSSPSANSEEKQLAAEIEMKLPPGTCFFAVDTIDVTGQSGKITVYVDLAVPASKGPDDLRSVATDIAHMLKTSQIAQRISSVRVTNWGAWEGSELKYESFLSDDNFQNHPWDGTPSREAEMAIWTIRAKK